MPPNPDLADDLGPVIDAHCHAGPGNGLTGPWDTEAPLDDYIRRARTAGISGTILYPAFNAGYGRANVVLAQIVAAGGPGYRGFAGIHPAVDAGRVFRLLSHAVGLGLCGIKVHRHDGRLTREICDAARSFRLPIVYDVMGEVSAVELLAQQYPDVAFIIPHLASFADDWRAQRAFIDVLTRYPNVHTDTSGVRRFDLLVEAMRRAGPTKIIFGSDGPWLHPGVELAKVLALGLPQHALRLVLSGNIRRLIGTPRLRRRPEPPLPPSARSLPEPSAWAGEGASGSEQQDPWLPAPSARW